jgi:hypothetical protein
VAELKNKASPEYIARSVQIAICGLPTEFSSLQKKGKLHIPVKSVFAAAFIRQRGKFIWQSVLIAGLPQFFAAWQSYKGRAKRVRICFSILNSHQFPLADRKKWQTGKLLMRRGTVKALSLSLDRASQAW